jgi:hypothetical protein
MTIRHQSSIVSFLIVAVIASLSASAAMTLRLPQMEGAAGSTVDVAINVEGAEKIGALQFDVNYDSTVLTAESASPGALATGALIEVRTDKPGRLFIALVTTESISGNGTVVTAKFKVIGAPGKVTPLEPARAQAWDGNTQREVLIAPAAGQLTVIEQGLPWLWILAGIAVLLILLVVFIVARRRSRARGLPARA